MSVTQQRLSVSPNTSSFELTAAFYDLGLPDFEAGTISGSTVSDAEGPCLLLPIEGAGATFEGGASPRR